MRRFEKLMWYVGILGKARMSQLKAFLHKAWIVKKRHPGALFLEIVLPLVFIGLSAVIARFIIRVEIDELPETIKYIALHLTFV